MQDLRFIIWEMQRAENTCKIMFSTIYFLWFVKKSQKYNPLKVLNFTRDFAIAFLKSCMFTSFTLIQKRVLLKRYLQDKNLSLIEKGSAANAKWEILPTYCKHRDMVMWYLKKIHHYCDNVFFLTYGFKITTVSSIKVHL